MAAQRFLAGSRAQLGRPRAHSPVDEWYSRASSSALHRSSAPAFHTHRLAALSPTALEQKGAVPRYALSLPAAR